MEDTKGMQKIQYQLVDAKEKIKKFDMRLDELKTEFDSNWKPHLIELSEHITTRKGRFLERDTQPNKGDKRTEKIYNNTAERSLSTLKAGVYSGLTPSSRPWMRLSLEDKDLLQWHPVKSWLTDVRDLMLSILQRSNFYSAIPSVYEEMGGFGYGSMLMAEDPKTVVRFYPFTTGECFLDIDHYLKVNTFYRMFKMKTYNIVDKFGLENVSDSIKGEYDNSTNAWHDVVHLIEPNDDRIEGLEYSINKPFRSAVYLNKGHEDKLLRLSGYDEFPVMAPRWDVTGSEVYGRCPGMSVLPDVKMLQKMEAKSLKALDKLVDPPLNAPVDARKRGVTTIPGSVNYFNSANNQNLVTPVYQVNPDFQAIEFKITKVEDRIKEGFYTDLFKMVSLTSGSPQKTAYEIAKKHEEKLQLLGPMVERVQPELLNPLVDRLYSIMDRGGLLPPPPDELEGMQLKIEYNSILVQAQKLIGTTAIEQGVGFVSNLMGLNQEAIDKLDVDESIDQYFDMLGAPPKIVRSDDEVVQIRKARQKKQQMMELAATMQGTIDGAKTMSETDTGENNALTQLLGTTP